MRQGEIVLLKGSELVTRVDIVVPESQKYSICGAVTNDFLPFGGIWVSPVRADPLVECRASVRVQSGVCPVVEIRDSCRSFENRERCIGRCTDRVADHDVG